MSGEGVPGFSRPELVSARMFVEVYDESGALLDKTELLTHANDWSNGRFAKETTVPAGGFIRLRREAPL